MINKYYGKMIGWEKIIPLHYNLLYLEIIMAPKFWLVPFLARRINLSLLLKQRDMALQGIETETVSKKSDRFKQQ